MSVRLNKTLGIACFTLLLQVGASSQNVVGTSSSENQESNLYKSSSSIDFDTSGGRDVRADKNRTGTVAEPNISPEAPELKPAIEARESHFNNQPFELPDTSVLGDAKPFTATAYALKGRTRIGTSVRRGVIAADPRVLPLGSVVQLKAGKYSGVYVVHDTGGKIKGNIVDVWMPSNKEARNFGRRKIKIHVLRKGGKKISK